MNLVVFSDIFGMGKALKSTWITIWLSLNDAVYSVVEILYKVFMSVAEVNLFSKEMFQKITGRVYVVVGIAMLFIFAYNLILMIINPDDKKGTGQMTKVVKETIITLVLIVLLPTIFNYLSVFQKHVLSSNIIGQIIMGGVGGTSQQDCDKYTSYNVLTQNGISSTDLKDLSDECKTYNAQDAKYRGAASIPPTLFSAFLHPTYYGYYDCEQYVEKCASTSDNSCQMGLITTDNDKQMCSKYYFAIENSKFSGSLSPFYDDYFKDKLVDENDSSLQFNYLLSFVAGCFALYMFVCYTLAIGVRVAKLGFLQILSPIASMMRIIPKKKEAIFDKWLKNVIDTYLDVFIRLAIIYFALFAISLVPDVINVLLTSFENIYTVKLLSVVVVILGILKFAQEAPKLLKDFFGGGDAFALKSPIKQLGENKLAMGGLGFVGAGLSSFAGNVWNAGKDVKNAQGFKGKTKAFARGIGYTASGTLSGAVRGARNSYDSKDFKDLGRNITEAKYATDAVRAEGLKNIVKHKAQKIGDEFVSFGQFITGSGASNFKLQAVEVSLKDIQNVNANFKNKKIEGFESAFSKMNDDYNNNKPLNFNGKQYERKENGWVNVNNSSDVMSHEDMGKAIKSHYDALKKAEYVSQYKENAKAFERLTSKMVDTLNDNLPKIGNDVLEGINKKLESTGIKFNDIDEITTKIEELTKKGNTSAIYDINDALEKNLKNVKKEVIIAQQEKKDK